MREYIECSVLAGRLGIAPAELDALIEELGLRVVEAQAARFLRVRDAAEVVKALDRPLRAMWKGSR